MTEIIIKAICAWCSALIREGETIDGHVTHGICPECAKKFLEGEWSERWPDSPYWPES